MMRTALVLVFFSLVACTSTAPPPGPLPAQAPWRSEPLARAAVPAVYGEQWQKAENRATCAVIAPRSLGELGANAKPRAANFAGGWAVAYDLPNQRSAFGIAGAGVKAGDPTYNKWPYVYEWGDGSKVEYGPEGGTGPNELAYLRIQGQDCLYNIWSGLGREHLETLIRELRLVR